MNQPNLSDYLARAAAAQQAADDAAQPERPRRSRRWPIVAAALAAGLCVPVWVALIREGDTSNTGIAVVAGIAALSVWSVAVVKHRWSQVTRRLKMATVVAAIVPPLLAGAGTLTQTVIDGEPILSTSDQAAAARQALDIESELTFVATADELFSFDLSATRANLPAFENAVVECAATARSWQGTQGVDDQFTAAIGALVSAADLCSRTAQAYIDAAESADARVAEEATALRASFIDAALAAGRQLSASARAADVPLAANAVAE